MGKKREPDGCEHNEEGLSGDLRVGRKAYCEKLIMSLGTMLAFGSMLSLGVMSGSIPLHHQESVTPKSQGDVPGLGPGIC